MTAAARMILGSAILVISNAMVSRAQVTMGDAFPEYQCPAAGTAAVGSDGTRIRYGGAAPDTPLMCLVEGAGARLLGLPPSIGARSSVPPRILDQVFQTGMPYFLVGDRPTPCREVPTVGPWPSPDITQFIGRLRRASIPALSPDVIILSLEAFKHTRAVRTEFENTEIRIDAVTRVPVRISIHRSLGPPALPAVVPRQERIAWRAVAIVEHSLTGIRTSLPRDAHPCLRHDPPPPR